jgi:hypothetical protein
LTPQTPFNLGYQVVGEAQVLERLCQDLGRVLRLAAIPCEALLCGTAATLSGFYVFCDGSCDEGHGVLLCAVWVCGEGGQFTHT